MPTSEMEDLLRVSKESHNRQTELLQELTQPLKELLQELKEVLPLLKEVIGATDAQARRIERVTAALIKYHEETKKEKEHENHGE